MAATTVSRLECLPLLALERICEYLDNNFDRRQILFAFSLVCRLCCATAASRRFCQVALQVGGEGENDLESLERQWTAILEPDARYRHVRRLKISRRVDRHSDFVEERDWQAQYYFDVDEFCRPSSVDRDNSHQLPPHEDWSILTRFLDRLTGLTDFVWSSGSRIPPSVLSAVHSRKCRLHMHRFSLPSLVQQARDAPQPVDPEDWALASSPCLSSVVLEVAPDGFTLGGRVDYIGDALRMMMAGIAPNLEHIWLRPAPPAPSEPHPTPTPGKLKSLVLDRRAARVTWLRHIDFTLLRRLTTSWISADAFFDIRFPSLDTLHLTEIDDETGQGQDELRRFLKNLPSLQRLSLEGYISPETFEIVLDNHGTLNSLSVTLHRDEELRNPLVVFSASMIQRLEQQCPNLEQLYLPINRTRGDREETAIYRALGTFPRLQHVWLNLQYSIGPDEQFWDEERDGEYPLSATLEEVDIPPEYLSETFSNGALDAILALSVFHTISSGNNTLACLMLDMSRKTGLNGPSQFGYGPFQELLRWFNRRWEFKRDAQGAVTVRERHRDETVSAGEEWQYLSGEDGYYGMSRVFEQVFKELWPPKTAEWWNDWESLPLAD